MNHSCSPFEGLLRALDDPNRHVRCRAAQELGESRDPRAVEPLMRTLRDRAGDVRAKAAVALGRLRDERAIGPLIEAMRDDKVSVRTAATAAVKKFGKRAYRPLLDAYRGAGGNFRWSLIGALAHYKTEAVTELLVAALDDPDQSLHREVVRLLGRRKDRRAVEPLIEALTGAKAGIERHVRVCRAAQAVGPLSGDRFRAEMAAGAEIAVRLDSYIRALGAIGDARAFGPLQELLEIQDAPDLLGMASEVVRALRMIDNPRAVDLLHQMRDDPSNPGRDRLALTLAGMDLLNVIKPLQAKANAGDIGVLWQALQATREAQEQLPLRDTSGTSGEISRTGTDLMRRLEEILRGLGRGQPGS